MALGDGRGIDECKECWVRGVELSLQQYIYGVSLDRVVCLESPTLLVEGPSSTAQEI